eukprot:TRINITY_DN432_c0_g2_i1.p1 TRINITY_DN432_c0_g2~~TRINITY_DN432_c0_g2_i1.p1  ORF type:complete len:413 (+),score=73.16 TRINITY_DN432_c0_g2_i1:200-1438(+)
MYGLNDIPQLITNVKGWQRSGELVVTLADVSDGMSENLSAPTKYIWYFSSPNRDLLNRPDRRKPNSECEVYMPLQSLAELIDMRDKLKLSNARYDISSEELKERASKYGNVPRWVFDNPQEAEARATRKLGEALFTGNLSITLKLDVADIAQYASHTFFHVTVQKSADRDWDFKCPSYQWASTFALHRVAQAALEEIDDKILAEINKSVHAGSVKGFLIEALWFERFVAASKAGQQGNKMSLKQFGTKGRLEHPDGAELLKLLKNMDNLRDMYCSKHDMACTLANEIKIMKPGTQLLVISHESDMMAIDGVLVCMVDEVFKVLFLQATINNKHPTNEAATTYLDSLIKAIQEMSARRRRKFQWGLVFILPEHRYDIWKAQTVHSPSEASKLMQFALMPGKDTTQSRKRKFEF